MRAASNAHVSVCRLLISRGAIVDAVNGAGKSTIDIAKLSKAPGDGEWHCLAELSSINHGGEQD
jgi:hypothetical protein